MIMKDTFKNWIIKNKLGFLYKGNYNLFTIDLYYQATILNKSFIGNQDTNYVIFSEKGEATAYYPIQPKDQIKLFNKKTLEKVIKKAENSQKKYQEFFHKYNKVSKKDINLVDFLNGYCLVYTDLVACFRTTRPVYVDTLVEKLKEKILATGAGESVFFCLLVPEKHDDIKTEQADWIFLLRKRKISPADLQKHAIKHPWLFPSVYNLNTAVKKLSSRYAADLVKLTDKLEEANNQQKILNKSLKAKKEYLNSYKNQEIRQLSETIIKLSDLRTYFKLTLDGMNLTFGAILKKISSKASLSPNIFYNSYTLEETRELLISKKYLPAAIIEQRNRYYIYIVKNLKNKITSDIQYLTIIKEYFPANKKHYIVGSCASAGIVVGVARVINSQEVKSLAEKTLAGKIIVTTMTDPSMMPFIRKCLAIITDQGGLTSHAAIISRELNIPCVVGTKNGTLMIKDGDFIEVNAEKGVVKILEKIKG